MFPANLPPEYITVLLLNYALNLKPEDIWYDAKTMIWLKAQFIKQGNWEYRLKKLN